MNREVVIRKIVAREIQKRPLSQELVEREDAKLFAEAGEHFGTWDTALRYAGISEYRVALRTASSRGFVLDQIRKLCRNGCNLSAQRIKERKRSLFEAANRHFGRWRAALNAVGVNPNNVSRKSKSRHHDRQQIIIALQQYYAAGCSLSWSVVCLDNHELASAAKNAFLTWRRALNSAGLPVPAPINPNRRWSNKMIVEAIQARVQAGKSLVMRDACREEPALVAAAQRHFGSWGDAMCASHDLITN